MPGASPQRPVVVIACDISLTETNDHQLAVDHLIDEVGVPIIFGPQHELGGPSPRATEQLGERIP